MPDTRTDFDFDTLHETYPSTAPTVKADGAAHAAFRVARVKKSQPPAYIITRYVAQGGDEGDFMRQLTLARGTTGAGIHIARGYYRPSEPNSCKRIREQMDAFAAKYGYRIVGWPPELRNAAEKASVRTDPASPYRVRRRPV